MNIMTYPSKATLRIWNATKALLHPIVGPMVRPIERWDDRQRAAHLEENAAVVEAVMPDRATEMREAAARLRRSAER